MFNNLNNDQYFQNMRSFLYPTVGKYYTPIYKNIIIIPHFLVIITNYAKYLSY